MKRLGENIFYDSASAHEWSDLNETAFLERVIAELMVAMGETFRTYDFFIFSAHHGNVRPLSAANPSPRKVLIFISDESSSIPLDLQPCYLAIFKCYLRGELPGTNIFPLGLGYVRGVEAYPIKPVQERPIAVFFSGNLNHHRLALYRALHPVYRRLPGAAFRVALSLSARGFAERLMPADLSHAMPGACLHFTDGFKRGLSPREYGERLADSRIVLCPRGWQSPETFRHLEAMRAGAVVISEPLPDTRFYRNAPILTVDHWSAGVSLARHLLDDRSALCDLHLRTVDWWQTVCSEAAIAEFMRSTIRGMTG